MNIRRLLGALRLTTSGFTCQRPSMIPSGSFLGLQVIRSDWAVQTEKPMTNKTEGRNIVKQDALPEKFPTHAHSAAFWESLGRTIATFGFLEEILSKAIFAFTATRPYEEHEVQKAYLDWLPKLERALMDPLGNLIDTYGKSVRDNPNPTIENLEELISDLRESSKIRNVLCHGSWGVPNANGASIPFFMNRQKMIFDTTVDCQFLDQVQEHVTELICSVINTVTHMGWQFPGSNGPGKTIWDNPKKTK